jgi:hypothetical protein
MTYVYIVHGVENDVATILRAFDSPDKAKAYLDWLEYESWNPYDTFFTVKCKVE